MGRTRGCLMLTQVFPDEFDAVSVPCLCSLPTMNKLLYKVLKKPGKCVWGHIFQDTFQLYLAEYFIVF